MEEFQKMRNAYSRNEFGIKTHLCYPYYTTRWTWAWFIKIVVVSIILIFYSS